MGFLPKSAWTKQREPAPLIAECGRCGLFKKCKNPYMPVDGGGRRKILLVAEGPGYNEDEQGKPLVGDAGCEQSGLLWELGVDMRRDCWLTNAIICRATDERDQNRPPTPEELRCCRPNLANTIAKYKPTVIVPLGKHACRSVMSLAWKDDPGEYADDDMARWAGWEIPSLKFNSWICPTWHPSFASRMREKNRAVRPIVQDHLRQALTHTARPYETVPDYRKQVTVLLDVAGAAVKIRSLIGKKPVAFDYETDRKKPDHQDSKIICCAVSDGEQTYAYPWHGEAIVATKELLKSNTPKIGANIQFEERWTWRHLGCPVKNWYWDVVLGAHWLNCVSRITSVKFQAFVLFGVEDYAYFLDNLIDSSGSNEPNKLTQVALPDLLLYNGLDALLEVMIAHKQHEVYDAQAV